MPFARYLDDEIWELRVRDRDGIYRVLYFHWKGRTFGLLHGFSKQTQKTPVRELTLAKQRRALWLGRGRPTKGRTRDG
jgi:phage-related protein